MEREFEAGEQILSATYQAKLAYEGIRARIVRPYEENEAEKALRDANANFDEISDREKNAYISRGIIYRRIDFFKSDFDAVFSCIPSAKIYFGKGVEEALLDIARAR